MSIPVPKTAMMLAAGLGSRMRPLTDNTPKPLLEVAGVRLIDHILTPLRAAGVEKLVVNVHHLADQVEGYLAQLTGIDIIVSDERGQRLETGGALAKARPVLGDDPVFVINTDAFWYPGDHRPFQELADQFDAADMDAALLLARTDRCLGFPGAGDVYVSGDGRVEFRGDRPAAPLAYSGVRIIRPQLYDDAPIDAFSAVDIWKRLAAEGRLFGRVLPHFWLHVGTPGALKDAEMWVRCHGG